MEYTCTGIIREFYHATVFLCRYSSNEQTVKAEKALLGLLCEIHGCREQEESWRRIEKARVLQLCSDETLLQTVGARAYDTALTLKLEVLQANQIERIKNFNPNIFTNELKEAADLGNKEACKLLAPLHWLGCILPENKKVAVKIWSALAVNGDWDSISALIYAHTQNGDFREANKWKNVLRILQSEYESFSPIALPSRYADCSPGEVQFANLIMFIKQKNTARATTAIDRPMIHYVLESKENFEHKMKRLSSETNYYLVMKAEDLYAEKKFGF